MTASAKREKYYQDIEAQISDLKMATLHNKEKERKRGCRKEERLDKLLIEGGAPLRGSVRIDGAKNAALPALAAALLGEERETLLQNVPPLVDIRTMCRLLEHMGATVEADGTSIRILPTELSTLEAPYDLVRTMRASILTLGPLVARYGYAKVSSPGGCAIGERPIDLR